MGEAMRSGTGVAERREARTFIETARRAQIVQAAIDTIAELGRRFYGDADIQAAVQVLDDLLARFQRAGEFRDDFDPQVMAVAIRAAIDSVSRRLAHDPELDVDHYAREIANVFDRATRASSS